MKRREFIYHSMLFTGSGLVLNNLSSIAATLYTNEKTRYYDLYRLFKDPHISYRPFVRWWWNGNKIEADELVRELRLLKDAGIGGVEINPIAFPSREEGDDLGVPSLRWLSEEWINMLQVTFDEAKSLGMICDLIVGSGWPFGAETLKPAERAQVMLLETIELEGPADYEISRFTIFKNVDPGVTVPYPGRTPEIISLKLVPDPVSSIEDATDLNDKIDDEVITVGVPAGKYFLYALVRFDSFASVINGAPGAAGPILNHMDKEAVKKYLLNMSDTIQQQTGPLSEHLRAFFTDSMELEGCNWTDDFPEIFKEKRGYDIMPWLPYIMFKVGRLGGVVDFNYGASKTGDFDEQVKRIRYDFELTKAELLYERFTLAYMEWCKDLGVKSRAQAYGRGFFPLVNSLEYDIPEGESWTTNWLKHHVGEEMPDEDYRRGRAYTMINKYVSSAAHLSGKRIVSCEEMTNTYMVFNTSLELLKAGSDQSIMSGSTHSVWHGFNYSPPEAPYPGWMQYGSYYNEQNNWWPYFKYLNDYKARLSSLLQNAVMYTDIAIMPANCDLWSELGVQTDPFPEKLNVPYTSLIWESINKNGGAADYITEIIINNSQIKDGFICYGPKKYGILILAEVLSINPDTLSKIHEFISGGGKVFCVEDYPQKSTGFLNHIERDKIVQDMVKEMRELSNNFILIKKPDSKTFIEWMGGIINKYHLPGYIKIEKTDPFLMQTRYQADNGSEIIFFSNSHIRNSQVTGISFSKDITENRYAWIYDPETGKRFRINPDENEQYLLHLGPAESRVFVFDKNSKGSRWQPAPYEGTDIVTISGPWNLEFIHSRNEETEPVKLDTLQDLKDIPEYSHFSGTVIYRKNILLSKDLPAYLNLGQVYNISRAIINNRDAGIKWYGNHIYNIAGLLKEGNNEFEIHIITLMGNYMKSLTDNPNAQYWTNLERKNQPPVPIGLVGPVTLYR